MDGVYFDYYLNHAKPGKHNLVGYGLENIDKIYYQYPIIQNGRGRIAYSCMSGNGLGIFRISQYYEIIINFTCFR